MKKPLNQENVEAAMRWWNGLLNGKKRYYKEHCKLSSEVKITNFYLAQIKQQPQTTFMNGANHGTN